MPTCAIPKLAAPASSRFRNTLLSVVPNPKRELRGLYSEIQREWEAAGGDWAALYRGIEPKVRELLLGARKLPGVPFGRIEPCYDDAEEASRFASAGDAEMACMYLGYALVKLHDVLGVPTAKLGYGYDISGEVGERGGTSGNDRHLWDTGNAPKHDHTQNNPANMMFDAEAESDYPELAKLKHKRVHWPPRTR